MRREQGSSISFPLGPLRIPINEHKFIDRIVALEQGIYSGIDIGFEPLAKEAIIEDIEQGYFPIIYLNHTSHYDGRPAAKAGQEILEIANSVLPPEKRYRGFAMPIATSIGTGNQHPLIKGLFESSIAREIAKAGIKTIPYTRDKDVEMYGLHSNDLSFFRTMINLVRGGYGIVVFPEATVEGGRTNGKNGIKGMQPFEEKTIRAMAGIALNQGYIPTFIPVGVWGSHNVLSPDNYMPKPSTLIRAVVPPLRKGVVKARVSVPIRWDDLKTHLEILRAPFDNDSVNNYLGGKLASLVPEHARGVYRNAS